jgi:hypothetical protein
MNNIILSEDERKILVAVLSDESLDLGSYCKEDLLKIKALYIKLGCGPILPESVFNKYE